MSLFRIKNNLYRIKSYWSSRKWLEEKPIFSFWKALFRGERTINETKSSFRLLLPTLPVFIKTVVYSVLIILIFELFNHTLPLKPLLDKNAIDTLLAAIASIMGIFLGLYFTAISSIASNFLIRATQDVRRFFLSAPRGQQYVQTIALTGIITIFYIVTKSFGYTIHPFALIFLSLLAAYVIIRFWSVGSDVFNSLEPTDSLPWVTKDIAESIKAVVPQGFQWQKPFTQYHHQRLVTYYVGVIDNLINFGLKEIRLSDEQLIVALKYIGDLLFVYSDNKRKIPTNSLWYKKRSQFQSWMLAGATEIALALNTGTTIQPKTAQDFTWFEEQNLDIASKILQFLANEKKVGSVFQGFNVFVDVAEIYGRDFDIQGIKLLFKKLEIVNDPIYSTKIDDIQQPIYKEQLAFVDSQGLLATAALLGLMKYLNKQTGDNLSAIISRIDWTSDNKNIYLAGLPLTMLSQLESTARELKNEQLIEGKILSPQWYIRTLCIQKYLFSLQDYFNFIKSIHTDYFQPKFEKLITGGHLSLAVQMNQRWLEFSNKYCRLVSSLKKHVEDCSQFHQVKDLPWVVFDFTNEEKVALDREKEVTDKMVNLLPKLKSIVTGDDLPDYFGQALTIGVQACYEACEDNDHERLKKIFPAVFDASLTAFDKTRQKVQDWSQEESKIIYSTEPLINLFELSGFAKLYSELYQNTELWDISQKLWDIYLGAVDAKQVILFISALVGYRKTLFMITPQAELRSNWELAFSRKVRERGLPVFPYDRDFMSRRERPNHPSPIIRVITRGGGLLGLDSAQEVFFAIYLSRRSEAKGIELPNSHNLMERVAREQEENNNEDE